MRFNVFKSSKKGMELVQVAILIAIAIALGLIFKTQIGAFVDNVFGDLLGSDF
ncbi:MAG: Flp1 family type IVb pilin [Eubacteriales bacterium]|nr:Flp1 family type IVb pilin [Eubacteriales bacterium]